MFNIASIRQAAIFRLSAVNSNNITAAVAQTNVANITF